MIDIILFIIFISGIIVYFCISNNAIFIILAIIAYIISHCIHQEEIIESKTEIIEDFTKYITKPFRKRGKKND